MQEQYRIVVAGGRETERKRIKNLLQRLGYTVAGEAEDGLTALKMLRTLAPDLVILADDLGGKKGIEIARIAMEDRICPAILVYTRLTSALLEEAREARVFSLLPAPVEENELLAAVELAVSNFQEISHLEKEVRKLREELQSRKIIERAKGYLMQQYGLTEEEAYRRLQKQSMEKRIPMRRIAEAILLARELKKD